MRRLNLAVSALLFSSGVAIAQAPRPSQAAPPSKAPSPSKTPSPSKAPSPSKTPSPAQTPPAAQAPGAAETPPVSYASDRQMEAAAKQRAASQAQTSPAPEGSFFSSGWASPAMLQLPASGPSCPAMTTSETDPIVSKAATQYKLNPDLIRAVIRQESAFYPCAVSDKGAMGLMQLMPDTVSTFKVADPFDPAQNVDSGAKYMKQLLGRFKGDLKLALAAYNAGPEKVDGPKPAVPNIAETKEYVDQIVKALNGAAAETTP